MSMINVTNLTFSYEGSDNNIFENVSFHMDTDWKLGFIGRNGRGKTTFMNLLLNKYDYEGTISSDVVFEYFPFEIKNKDIPTMDIIDQMKIEYNMWELEREMSLLDIPRDVLERKFSSLSKGEQTKIMLAFLFAKDNKFLLIDEPTNHLDMMGRKKVSEYLKSKKGFILISHDREFIDGCVDHILSINKSNVEVQRGNFSTWKSNKDKIDNFEMDKNCKLKKDIKRMEEAVRKTANWSEKSEGKKSKKDYGDRAPAMIDKGFVGAKAAKIMKKAKNIERRQSGAIEEKAKLLHNIEYAPLLKIHPEIYNQKTLVTLDDVSIYYNEKSVCKNVKFSIEKGDRVSLYGKNGSGKSSILKLILGDEIKYTGNFIRGSQITISYVSQETNFLKGRLNDYIQKSGVEETLFKTILRKMDFSREHFERKIDTYSEGQKKKILIAKSLCEKAHLYIWDEPLNFIDVYSRMQIEDVILEYNPTIIFVEHDKVFMEKIANKIIEI
ncbi:ribosomal protection-like ABC-F family protein [Fusobacterium sp. PH5-44]|uniref:ribosomal protection-like ABC-F family protein n=1 Tax=unclassified Fusobacterium TaxID=2648384 RepID=UPI003D19B010